MSITENPLAGNASLSDRDALAASLPALFALSGIAVNAAEARAVARTLQRLAPTATARHPSSLPNASSPNAASVPVPLQGTPDAPAAVSVLRRAIP